MSCHGARPATGRGSGRPVARIVGAPQDVMRTAGDWVWHGTYDKSAFAPMTDDQLREEGWPI